MRDEKSIGWTPKAVAAALMAAARWARYNGGPIGPAGVRSAFPAYRATLDDHLDEGWGLPEIADDDRPEDPVLRIDATPDQVTAYQAALQWQARYLYPDHVGSSRLLGLWIRCKLHRASFDGAVKARRLPRATAYRMRDRALGLIAAGLDRDGVAPPGAHDWGKRR